MVESCYSIKHSGTLLFYILLTVQLVMILGK